MASPQAERAPGGFVVRGARELHGLDLAEVDYAPGFAMGVHDHPQAYLTAVLDGTYDERMTDAGRRCERGDVVFRPVGEPHASRFHDGGARCLRVRLAGHWMERVLAGGRMPDRSLAVRPERAGWLSARLHLEFRAGDPASAIAIEGLVLLLMAEVLRLPGPPKGGGTPAWLSRVVDRVYAQFRERLTLAALAEQEGVHPAHLARVFRRVRGQTVAACIRRLRLEWAMCELRGTRRSLSSIAHEAGFADQSHLTRTLKSATGVTPRAFRERSGRAESSSDARILQDGSKATR